jgi:peptidoglycan hydrolase CwlO-like protein
VVCGRPDNGAQLKLRLRFAKVPVPKETQMTRLHASARRSYAGLGRSALGYAALLLACLALLAGSAAPRAVAASTAGAAAKERSLAAQVVRLDGTINGKVEAYVRATSSLLALRAQISQNAAQIKDAKRNLGIARSALSMSVVATYKQQNVSLLDVMLSSSSFSDLLGGLDLMRRVNLEGITVVEQLESLEKQITDGQRNLQAEATASERLALQLAGEIKQIRRELAARQHLLAGARAEVVKLIAQQQAKAALSVVVVSQSSPGSAAQPSPSSAGQTSPSSAGQPSASQPSPSSAGVPPDGGSWWPLVQAAAAKYGVNAAAMYRLMMVESGGDASASNGGTYLGLFQYAPATWRGSWNPWHGASLLDGEAQIQATALALHLGHGPAWWSSSYSWAFGQ